MRILDLEELKKSQYVIISALKVKDRVTGYTFIDKALLKSVKEPDKIMNTLSKALDEGFILKLDFTVDCPENDKECIERARALGLEPGQETIGLLGVVILPTALIDFEKLKQLLQQHFGDIYESLTAWYCNQEELEEYVKDYMFQIQSFLMDVDEDRLARMNVDLDFRRVIIVNSDYTYTISAL